MANGFSVAALVGKKEIMNIGSINRIGEERTFLISTTHGGEMPSLAAFVETIAIYKENNVIQHLWDYGKKLFNGINDISKNLNISDYFFVEGGYISMNYVTKNIDRETSMQFRTLFAQEMINNGVLMPWIAPSLSHGEIELKFTLEAVEKSLIIYKAALENGISKFLKGSEIKPVFRKFN
jgi:glutamate-1-semialdehyde 2,1-aminomutase